MHVASLNGKLGLLMYCCRALGSQCGPSLQARVKGSGIGVSHLAAMGGHVNILQYLFEEHQIASTIAHLSGDAEMQADDDSCIPLHAAIVKHQLHVVSYIL